nr:DUF5915 domain-containing protein [Anaerolineae bacterium]
VAQLGDLIAAELNVKQVQVLAGAGDVVSYKLNPLPAALGKKLGKDFPKVQKALREGDAAQVRAWAQALLKGESVSLTLDDVTYEVTAAECEVKQAAADGYAVAEDNGYLAAVDTRLTDALRAEGLAREVVRRVQDSRKKAGLEIEDRIVLSYVASGALAEVIETYKDSIADEVLAVSITHAEPSADQFRAEFAPHDDPKQDTSVRGERLVLGIRRA